MTAGAQHRTGTRPQPGPPRTYHFPRFERRTLGNGLRLVVAPVTKLPIATVLLMAEAGATADPGGREGLAQLTARALLEGTRRSDGAQLTERFERLGAAVDAAATWDTSLVRMTVLSSRLAEALALFGETVLDPAFPEREVERLKAERLAELLQLRTEPRGLADEMFSRFLYDQADRYARPEGGSEDSVRAITREDLARFYAERYRPGGMTLIIAGDVSTERAAALAEQTLGAAPAGTPPRVQPLGVPARPTRASHVVAKSDAPQSELRIGQVGLPRSHPDYFRLVIMNAVLGGLFSSRINLNLREVHGYTYGAHSDFEWRRGAGPFVVSTAVKSDVTDASAREVLREIDRLRDEDITPDELSLATSYLDGVFPIRYETTDAIAAALANLIIYGLPDDYYDTYRSRIRAVSESDVREMASRYLDPDRLQLLAVGDPEVIRAPLERLRFGPLTVYDAEGRALD
jgi:zinc protease